MGNTCYINAVLQALFAVPSFRHDILSKVWQVLTRSAEAPLFKALVSTLLATEAARTEQRAVDPSRLRHALARYASTFASNQQQDAHEFLLSLLNCLDDELRPLCVKALPEIADLAAQESAAKFATPTQVFPSGRGHGVSPPGAPLGRDANEIPPSVTSRVLASPREDSPEASNGLVQHDDDSSRDDGGYLDPDADDAVPAQPLLGVLRGKRSALERSILPPVRTFHSAIKCDIVCPTEMLGCGYSRSKCEYFSVHSLDLPRHHVVREPSLEDLLDTHLAAETLELKCRKCGLRNCAAHLQVLRIARKRLCCTSSGLRFVPRLGKW